MLVTATTTSRSVEQVRDQWHRCQNGEYWLAGSLWQLVEDTGGFERSPWVWLAELDRDTLQAMMCRETITEARELAGKCRSGALVPNVEALRLLCAHQDDEFFQEIALTRDELDMFVHARWLQKGRAAVARCQARQRARRFDPVAFETIAEARQHGISLQELGLSPTALANLGQMPT